MPHPYALADAEAWIPRAQAMRLGRATPTW